MSNFRDLLKQNGQGVYSPSNKPTLDVLTGTAVNSAKLNNKTNSTAATAGTIAERDSSGDINVRLIRPNYSDQNTITGAMAFRVNNSTDNYVRFCNSKPAIRTYLETYSKAEADDRFLNKTTGKVADSDKLDGLDSGSFLRSDADDLFSGDLVSSTRNKGLFGAYDSTKIDHIWSMGTTYRINENGASFGNLYGLAYKHTNNPTGGTMAGGHQMVWCNNGSPRAALGNDGVWSAGMVTAGSFINSNHSFRFNNKIAIGGTNDTWLRLNPNDDFTSGVVINGKVVTSSPQGADANALTRKDYVDGTFVKKAGDTMTGRLDVTAPPKSTNIADTYGYAKIRMDLASTGGTAGTYFYPLTSQRARHDQGYVTHVTTGLVKNGYGSGWGEGVSGYFVGVGGNDGHPTEYFTMAYGGKIKHSRGHEFYSTAFKPTAGDVGAVSKAGDTMTGKLKISSNAAGEGFEINTGSRNGSGVYIRMTDQAGAYTQYGTIGFFHQDASSYGGDAAFVFGGSSDVSKLNVVLSSSGNFKVGNNEVYHQGNKPTASDVGAQPANSKLTDYVNSLVSTVGQDFRIRDKRALVGTTSNLIINYASDFAQVEVQSSLVVNHRVRGKLGVDAEGTAANEGLAFCGKTAIGGSNDAWLRINPHSQFSSGVYCGATGVLRHDNEIQANAWIGGNRAAKFKANHSDIAWGTNGNAAVAVNNPDSSGAHWMLASYYDGTYIRAGIQVLSNSDGRMRLYTNRRSNYVEVYAGNVFAGSAQSTSVNALTRKDYVDGKVSGVTANGVKINLPAPSTSNPAIHIKYGPQGDDYDATTLLQWNEKPVVHTSVGGFGRARVKFGDLYSYNHLVTRDRVQIESNDGTGGMVACYYTGAVNKETNFPVGTMLVAWVGPGYYQSKTNQTTTMYVVTDNEGYPRYGTAWYNNHSSGVAVAGTWANRGYVGSLGNVQLGLMQRIG
ncbi:hypothetical protein Q9X96_003089 [Vibrio vulnificus]|nr:hypothetical protein [Vibrio vulnificus]